MSHKKNYNTNFSIWKPNLQGYVFVLLQRKVLMIFLYQYFWSLELFSLVKIALTLFKFDLDTPKVKRNYEIQFSPIKKK